MIVLSMSRITITSPLCKHPRHPDVPYVIPPSINRRLEYHRELPDGIVM
jgi:hypothetical protein